MTDKSIIIDGVDVSGCDFLCNGKFWCEAHKILVNTKKMLKGDGLIACNEKYNCYYKQLQRKTAECEELKKALAIKTGKDYINEIQDIQMKYECHQKSLGMCWWGKYGKETECIGIRECHKKELEVIKNLEHKLQKATEALDLILNGYGNDELDLENDYNPIRIADEALEQLESEE